jgi:hypothetical protein
VLPPSGRPAAARLLGPQQLERQMKIQVRRFGILQTAKVLGVMYFIAGMFFFHPDRPDWPGIRQS